jgi:probable HAF family extracellular repeat protein
MKVFQRILGKTMNHLKNKLFVFGVIFAVLLLGLFIPISLWADSSITDLGTFGSDTYAYGINDSGQVVGDSYTSDDSDHAFIWQNGVMTDLDTLGGGYSYANGINSSGQVVGCSLTSDYSYHAFIWQNGVMTDLGTFGSDTYAYGINDSGQVAGYSMISNGNYHAFIWQNGVMTDLGTLGGGYYNGSRAWGINNSGQVAGYSYTSDGSDHFFIWQNGVMTDLGTLGGTGSYVGGINDSGQVVGSYITSYGPYHAFIWQNGVMTDLGTLGGGYSYANGINNSGQVVGDSYTSDGSYHAFIWQNGTMTDLNTLLPENSGWELQRAGDINNSGQIVGAGVINGQYRAFLFTIKKDITDLAVKAWTDENPSVTANSVTLTWRALTNADSYDIRYSTIGAIMSDTDFNNATKIPSNPVPLAAGTTEEFTVTKLGQGTQYYFAMKYTDNSGIVSDVSNCPSATTLLDVPDIKQYDSSWRDDGYDHIGSTIGKSGCALTCMTMIINYYAQYHPEDDMRVKITTTTPRELNIWLKNHNGYTGGGGVVWGVINAFTNKAILVDKNWNKYNRTDVTLNQDLNDRMPVVASVRNPKIKNSLLTYTTHFIVITGSCAPVGYTANDPGYSANKSLNKYNNNYTGLRRFKPGDRNEKASSLTIYAYPK